MQSFIKEKKTPVLIFLTGMVIRLILVAIANYQLKLYDWQGLFLGKGYNLENNLILVKGSRGMNLDRLVEEVCE